ncbi:SAM-dependent methyltransferase [Pelagicoccus albus]|uniref:SAM-dependent methyltransferase n=1 Tax=Pelagicoccus albus TaxID=415222 RepID=A0A7X1B3H9_9BACT|nr:SAM-dependent methyltransferase [Pelagicoccus albus]MBC2604966.1 SAM-dependent methyltransferase [Pelagicoccus albus]
MTKATEQSSELLTAIGEKANADGFIELPDFIQTALYHPTLGYYCRDKKRVGRESQSDFFTSISLKEAFGEIVLEATLELLKAEGLEAADTHWVELGAEPGGTLFDQDLPHFKSISTIGVGQALEIPEQAVVFSNELFDAQTFRQIRFDGSQWVEFGVRAEDSKFVWAPRKELSEEVLPYVDQLETDLPSGYTIDLPLGANILASRIAKLDWSGVFLAFDYGKVWKAMAADTPQGTARAYKSHQQLPNILEAPGEIDITHHICWDHIEDILQNNRFEKLSLQSQEAFIVRRAPNFLQKAFDPNLPAFSPVRQKLKELMHPAMMGQKFQALTAIRKLAR